MRSMENGSFSVKALRRKNKIWKYTLLCSAFILAAACSKDKQLDRDQLSMEASNNTYSFLQTGNIVYLNGNGYSMTGNHLGLPITLTEAARSADTVIATVDPSLVASYNRLHNENNPAIPVAAFGASHLGVFPVSSGETQLRDSLYATLENGASLIDNTVYLVPIRLTARRNSKISTTTVYFKLLFTIAQLNARMQGVTVLSNMVVGRVPGGALNVFCNNGCPDSLRFGIALNSIFPAHETDVEAVLMPQREVDSLVNANGYYATPMPSQVYSISRGVIKVSTTSRFSRDSITVRFANKELITRGIFNYMGLKIRRYTGSDYGVSPIAVDSSKVLVRVLVQ